MDIQSMQRYHVEKIIDNETYFFFKFPLPLLSEKFLILRRIQRDIAINLHRYSCKVSSFLPDFNETWIFLHNYSKNTPNIKVDENPSILSRVFSSGRKDT
jgi:hypothetical protein